MSRKLHHLLTFYWFRYINIVNNIPANGNVNLKVLKLEELFYPLCNKMNQIVNFILKNILDIIIKPLTLLINMSFCSVWVFPDEFKVGKIVPIYKRDGRIDSYRPITILNFLFKVFEYAFMDTYLVGIFNET